MWLRLTEVNVLQFTAGVLWLLRLLRLFRLFRLFRSAVRFGPINIWRRLLASRLRISRLHVSSTKHFPPSFFLSNKTRYFYDNHKNQVISDDLCFRQLMITQIAWHFLFYRLLTSSFSRKHQKILMIWYIHRFTVSYDASNDTLTTRTYTWIFLLYVNVLMLKYYMNTSERQFTRLMIINVYKCIFLTLFFFSPLLPKYFFGYWW